MVIDECEPIYTCRVTVANLSVAKKIVKVIEYVASPEL